MAMNNKNTPSGKSLKMSADDLKEMVKAAVAECLGEEKEDTPPAEETAGEGMDVMSVIEEAVEAAAEQIYTGSGRGEEKKEYVINWLREHGITVDEAKLDALIEAAVYELNTNGIVPVIGIPDAVVTTTIETTTETPKEE